MTGKAPTAPRIVHAGLDGVPSSGGSMAAIRDFHRAAPGTVVAFTDNEKFQREGSAIPGTVQVLTGKGLPGRAFRWAGKKSREEALAIAEGADILACHILLRYHVHWVGTISRRRGIPYWAVPHGCLDPFVFSYRALVKKIWFRLFGRPFLEKAAAVIFITRREMEKAAGRYAGPNRHVIRLPVEAPDAAGKEEAAAELRRQLGVAAEERLLLVLGRLHWTKNVLEAIEAFAKAAAPNLHLVIAGPDETVTRAGCEARAAALGAKNVHAIGPVFGEEKDRVVLGADGYLSLSLKENFSYTAAESLAAGQPVILSPGNDLAADIKGLGCGWMLPDGSRESAAAALREFAAMPGEPLREMGLRGREWAMRELSFETFKAKIEALAIATARGARESLPKP